MVWVIRLRDTRERLAEETTFACARESLPTRKAERLDCPRFALVAGKGHEVALDVRDASAEANVAEKTFEIVFIVRVGLWSKGVRRSFRIPRGTGRGRTC